ncbi:MAG: bifunctional diaminohydroxyphosphoribosylaminopyrimidine deaminase/5-amino-6-(5-phosphoribosylamino)uracil reductase RibD [Gammaproteobacteria bacterium]|nr:bifunctional diaminohydroxyphosphoribosylaminopyrimidine deaminase/5-amino-6-(5-phosphoribosylamino)uracil reductase RibD [Gammaproteobacteria bacterium]
MARALQLATRGQYTAHPNPMVGCVLVKDGVVVGEGWHECAGEPHAEVNALGAAAGNTIGATAYVTLEPCAHHGKTPPCAQALIDAGVSRVIAAMRDPYAQVAGRGIEALQNAGVATEVGLMQSGAERLNEGYIRRVTGNRPFVRVKVAASIDGAIAMKSGESQWITGGPARNDVQHLRARSGAIMTGIGTVLADDPSLDVRLQALETRGLQPLRVVLDSHLCMPLTAAMLARPGHTLVCCCGNHDDSALQRGGAEVRSFGEHGGVVEVGAVLDDLARRGVNDLLVEAGPGVMGHLLENDLIDELVIYQAPHIMGSETRGMFRTPSWSMLADRRVLEITDVRRVGGDTKITARVQR